MDYQHMYLVKEFPLAMLTLNRPEKRNALSSILRKEIQRCLHDIEADEKVSVAIITGSGTAFCSGFDLTEMQTEAQNVFEMHEEAVSDYHHSLAHFSKPLVAAVNGPAFAGGFDLALFCDIRIAGERASFAHPEIKFGVPALYEVLKEVVGGGYARDLCLTGRSIDATEAYRIGLVSQIVPDDQLILNAKMLAQQIAESPLHNLKRMKKMICALSVH